MYRKQRNITISVAQVEFVKANKDKMNIGQLSKMLGLPYQKLHNNLRLLGFVKPRKTPIVKMEGYFDVEAFSKKYYNF